MTRARRVVACLAAAAAVAGGVVVLGTGPATGATVTVTREHSAPCQVNQPGVPQSWPSARVTVEFDAPDTAVAGQPTAPVPWRATGGVSLDVGEGSPMAPYLAHAGATSVTTDVSVLLSYYQPGSAEHRHQLDFSGDTALPAPSLALGGSGVLPPFVFPTAGERVTAIWFASFLVKITPRKADGSATVLGTIPVHCDFVPSFIDWHGVAVSPGPAEADYAVAARTRLAGTDVDLGTGTLTLTEAGDKAVTGAVVLPGKGTAALRLLGVIPATATARLTPGPLTGTFAGGFTAPATVTVSDFAILGVPLMRDKNTCQSTTSLTLTAGDGLTIDHGGTLTGTYDLPAFTGCGPYTGLISGLFAGVGNPVALGTTG